MTGAHPIQLPIEVVFNLLCVCRTGSYNSLTGVRAALRRRGLYFGNYASLPRLPFWIRICQGASLLDQSWPPYPTLLAADWFAFPVEKKIWTLLQAWLSAPSRKRQRALRARLLDKLLAGDELGPSYGRELPGLRALSFYGDERLTPLGEAILTRQAAVDNLNPISENWALSAGQLHVPYPPSWGLLWQLEAYLEPSAPGIYPLTPKALRNAVVRGGMKGLQKPALITILSAGIGQEPPAELITALESIPRVRVLPGPVLSFEDPQELLRLRENASLRKDLQDVLSPRHVHLEPWAAPAFLRRLYRQGLLSRNELEWVVATHPAFQVPLASYGSNRNAEDQSPPAKKAFTRAERTYLLSLLLLAEGLGSPQAPPPGLILKLVAGLDAASRSAAARKANKLLALLSSRPSWVPEAEPPLPPEEKLIVALQQAIESEETISVLYQAPGKHSPEHRRISPLIIEQRGPRYYLLAYCHTRRANRTFRLDRLQLVDFPPEI